MNVLIVDEKITFSPLFDVRIRSNRSNPEVKEQVRTSEFLRVQALKMVWLQLVDDWNVD